VAFKKPILINNLIASSGGRIGALQAAAAQAQTTLSRVQEALPAAMKDAVHAASFEADGVLTLLVDNGSIASRLRYALPELLPKVLNEAGEAALKGRVRVRPRATGRAQP
jgi:hypothetical protein